MLYSTPIPHIPTKTMNLPQTSLVFDRSGKAVTDSLTVARAFGKRHSNVLQAIDEIRSQLVDSGLVLNFMQSSRVQRTGFGERDIRTYLMDEKAFTVLVFGFTGKKALKVKLDFIGAFQALSAQLQHAQQQVIPALAERIRRLEAYIEHQDRLLECARHESVSPSRHGGMFVSELSYTGYAPDQVALTYFQGKVWLACKDFGCLHDGSKYKRQRLADYLTSLAVLRAVRRQTLRSTFHGMCVHIDVEELVELFRNGAELLPKKRRPSPEAAHRIFHALRYDLGKLASCYPSLPEAVPHPDTCRIDPAITRYLHD